jgi:hypothetical protein
VLITAIVLDVGVLGAFGAMKLQSDPLIVIVATVAITAVFGIQRIYLGRWTSMGDDGHAEHKRGGSRPRSMRNDQPIRSHNGGRYCEPIVSNSLPNGKPRDADYGQESEQEGRAGSRCKSRSNNPSVKRPICLAAASSTSCRPG